MYRNGIPMSGHYITTPEPKISEAFEEIMPSTPDGWTLERHILKKISFYTRNDCTVIINGESGQFLYAGSGLEFNYDDPLIHSLVIVEAGIEYLFMGSY